MRPETRGLLVVLESLRFDEAVDRTRVLDLSGAVRQVVDGGIIIW